MAVHALRCSQMSEHYNILCGNGLELRTLGLCESTPKQPVLHRLNHDSATSYNYAHSRCAKVPQEHPDHTTQVYVAQGFIITHTPPCENRGRASRKSLQDKALELRTFAHSPIYKKREKAFPGKPRVGYHPHFVVGVDNHTRSRPSRNPEHIGVIADRVMAYLSRRVKP